MPRHGNTLVYATAPSGEAFLEGRKPQVIYVEPEPVWILDSYRVKRWYYRAAPDVGEKVHYLEDGFATRVKRVTPFAIYLDDASVMRRPFSAGRLIGWSLPRLRKIQKTAFAPRSSSTGKSSDSSTRHPNRQVILF